MKKFVLALSIAILALPAFAQSNQQDRMKACNADAAKREMKGEERKAFMKQCLATKKDDKGSQNAEKAVKPEKAEKTEKKELTPQQARMKKCNADAKEKALKGEERKSFMKGCLSAG